MLQREFGFSPPASPNRVKDGPHTDRMHLHITCHFVCSSHHMKSWLMSFSRKATNVDGLQRAQEKALPAGSTTLHTAHRPRLHESTGAFAPPVFQFQTGLRERKKMKPSWSNLTTERHNKCLDRICLWCKMVRILRLFSAVIKVFFFVQVGSNWPELLIPANYVVAIYQEEWRGQNDGRQSTL